MRKNLLILLTAGFLTGFLQAQNNCATLTVQQNQNQQTVTFHINSDPGSLVGLVFGLQTGSTTIPRGALGTIQLGIAAPYEFLFLGAANGGGNVTYVAHLPANLPAINLVAQAVTVLIPDPIQLPLNFCTSSVAQFQVGP